MTTATRHQNPEPIRARIGERETGWVVPIGEYLCRIDNIPIGGTYNLGDIVALIPRTAEDTIQRLGRLVFREYQHRFSVFPVDEAEKQFALDILDRRGMAVELMVLPSEQQHGLIMVAAREMEPVRDLLLQNQIEVSGDDLGGDQ